MILILFFFALDDQTVYSNIVDIFEFYGINIGVSNSVQGLGQTIYSNATAWGSSGKLKSVMFLPHYNFILYGPSLHELCHNWGAFICPTYSLYGDPYGGHWGVSNAGGQLGGFKYIRTIEENCDGIAGKTKYQASMDPRKRADGSFLKPGFGDYANGGNSVPYSDIELYLMGMKSAQELRDANFRLDIYSGNSYDYTQEGWDNRYFYSTGITSYTIDDLIALQGERIPDASVSQKHFKLLTVLLQIEKDESYYSDVISHLKYLSGSYAREGYYSFNEATRGAGSLEAENIKKSLKSNLSNDATLKNLMINKGTVSPAFEPSITDYTVQAENNVESIIFTAVPNHTDAFVIGDGVKSLHVGENAFDITVEAENAAQKIYRITVTRQPSLSGSSDATLSNITVNNGNLTPAFNSNVTQYTVQVDKTVENMTINAIPNHSAASVAGDGTKILNIGKNIYDMVVTSENGSIKTYSVTVIRSTQSNADFEVVDGVLIAYHGEGGKVEIPGNLGITAIGNFAFVLPDAQSGKLTSITIPSGVTRIGNGAFANLHHLGSITIPEGVTEIGQYAFSEFPFTSVTIPSSVNSIGDHAFSQSISQLVSINVKAGNSIYSPEDGMLFDKAKTRLIQYPAGKPDVTYTIPRSVKYIDWYAFEKCKNLTSIIIPDNVKIIEGSAFADCSNLQSIIIPNSVTDIGLYAFAKCTKLTSVVIPQSVVSVGEGAFSSCSNLSSISVKEENLNYISEDDILFNKTKTNLICYPAGKQGNNYIIPTTITDIGIGAFQGCKNLVSVTIPDGIKEIKRDCFHGCSSLSSIIIPYGVTTIESGAIAECMNLSSITIPISVKNIQGGAFYYCDGLQSVDVSWVTPLNIESSVFVDVDISQCNLLVPYGTKSLYETTDVWKDFGTIEEKPTVAITGISISRKSLSLEVNSTEQLTATVLPENATNNAYTWGTSDASIVTVSDSGLVMAIAAGTSYVFATITDSINVFADSCLVTVTIPIVAVTGISLNITDMDLKVDSIMQLTATITPENADNKTVIWTSDDNSVATVSSTGLVRAIAEGQATITATAEDGGYTARCTVTVQKNRTVTVDEGKPVGSDGKGSIEISLEIPSSVPFTGTFRVNLPNGMSIDVNATKLAGELGTSLILTITQESDSSWLFSITPKNLRSAAAMSYQKIMDIVYTVEELVPDGAYGATVSDLNFSFEDGTSITESEITVPITVDHSYTGLSDVSAKVKAYISGNILYIDSPVDETVNLYSGSGLLLQCTGKTAGEAQIPLNGIRDKILIVKGSSGWVKKGIRK
jgi:uncharacterized protein YjdB